MSFIVSDPNDRARVASELHAWEISQKDKLKEQKRETRRYWITTGIAIAALIKSFLPEIAAAVEALSRLLTP